MTTSLRLVLSSVVTFMLAMPALADAQARTRGGGDSGSSGSSGSSNSGGSGERSSPEPSSPSRPMPQDAPRSGFATPRGDNSPPPMPSGDSARPANRDAGRSGVASVGGGRPSANDDESPRVNPDRYRMGDSNARPRDGRPTTGFATRRTSPPPFGGSVGGGGSSWSNYYPWYGSGLNWYYSPYSAYGYGYGSSRWIWGRYGMWYDPYDPFGYYTPGAYSPGYGGYGSNFTYGGGGGGYSSSSGAVPMRETTGSVRVRVSPRQGKIYVDGTFMGVVDDFDGLRNHLATTTGLHEIEIRADGYQPLKLHVNVEEDRTITVRGSLKKD